MLRRGLGVVFETYLRILPHPSCDDVNGRVFQQLSLPTRTEVMKQPWPRLQSSSFDEFPDWCPQVATFPAVLPLSFGKMIASNDMGLARSCQLKCFFQIQA